MNDENSSFAVTKWRPGSVRKMVIASAESLTAHEIVAPPHSFYEVLAERAEERAIEAISEALGPSDDATVLANIRIARRLMQGIPVLAFSPVEVEADASACASEINSALAVLAQELLPLHGIDHPPARDFRPKYDK